MFANKYPQVTNNWIKNSNYIAVLAIDNETKLLNLLNNARIENIKTAIFREPDLGNQLTAVVLEPGEKSKKLTKKLKLIK